MKKSRKRIRLRRETLRELDQIIGGADSDTCETCHTDCTCYTECPRTGEACSGCCTQSAPSMVLSGCCSA